MLALWYESQGRWEDAITVWKKLFELRKKTLGEGNRHTLTAMHSLAMAYKMAGRTDDAIQLQKETLKLRRDNLGADDPDTRQSMQNLASDLQLAGRPKEALPLYQEALSDRALRFLEDGRATGLLPEDFSVEFAE